MHWSFTVMLVAKSNQSFFILIIKAAATDVKLVAIGRLVDLYLKIYGCLL